jgi:hypothetical protein
MRDTGLEVAEHTVDHDGPSSITSSANSSALSESPRSKAAASCEHKRSSARHSAKGLPFRDVAGS